LHGNAELEDIGLPFIRRFLTGHTDKRTHNSYFAFASLGFIGFDQDFEIDDLELADAMFDGSKTLGDTGRDNQ